MTEELATPRQETMQFQAEIKQLLSIVVNSLYTHKEVFLRELIANASDALDKLRFLALTDASVLEDSRDLSIFIDLDRADRTLTISDNGIGMTYDEVVENIGTIASSGSSRFMELIRNSKSGGLDTSLIGQFGVGFYSAFMVAEKITLLTRAPNRTLGVKWESEGDSTYRIEEVEKKERGTTIILKLKQFEHDSNNFDEDFLNAYTIQKHVQKHCSFITYPIRMNFVTEEPERAEDGTPIEGKLHTVVTEKTLNPSQPLWARDPREVEHEEYVSFYRQQFNDWNDPSQIIHTRGEGIFEFTALMFIPAQAPYGFYTGVAPKGPQLYCKHVLVMNDCPELLPEYLRFIRAIVDSPDLPLNISREMLQHDRQIGVMRGHLEKRVLVDLKTTLADERPKYEQLWAEYGKALKSGIFIDRKNVEKLQDLLLFDSSHSESRKTTLSEYVARMPEGQKEIYYATGEGRPVVERMPQMELLREKGYEVLYFLDKVDEFLTQHLPEYAGKPLRSVSRGSLDLQDEAVTGEADKSGESDAEYQELLAFVREALAGKVKDVRLSGRLKTSPVCLVSGDSGYSLNMERLMREANQPMFKATRILELNPTHEVVKTIHALLKGGADRSKLSGYCRLLHDQALLIENEKIEDPLEFARLVSELLVEAHGGAPKSAQA